MRLRTVIERLPVLVSWFDSWFGQNCLRVKGYALELQVLRATILDESPLKCSLL